MLRLSGSETKRLLAQPETGMGYQRVDIHFVDGRILEDFVVFNAQEFEVAEEFVQSKIRDVSLHAT